MAAKRARRKPASTKIVEDTVFDSEDTWVVCSGVLQRRQGRPGKAKPLFLAVGEKLPFESLRDVKADLEEREIPTTGVYIAHDSMGVPRYIGRGNIFGRLALRKKKHDLELLYFSFYVVSEKVHEREIETLLIRSSSAQLLFNERKKRTSIDTGNVRDYEAGTVFYERQRRRGRKRNSA